MDFGIHKGGDIQYLGILKDDCVGKIYTIWLSHLVWLQTEEKEGHFSSFVLTKLGFGLRLGTDKLNVILHQSLPQVTLNP